MTIDPPKDELIKMLVNKTLFNFLMKKNLIKKGDMVCYGRMLGITSEDLRQHFEQNGYPGLTIPANSYGLRPKALKVMSYGRWIEASTQFGSSNEVSLSWNFLPNQNRRLRLIGKITR